MKATLLNAVTDSTTGDVHSQVNNKLIKEDLTFQLVLTGAPTAVTVTVYGSTDNVNFNPMAAHDVIADGELFHIVGKNVRYINAAVTTLTGGTAPTVTLVLDYE